MNRAIALAIGILLLAACSGIAPHPGIYQVRQVEIALANYPLELTLVAPEQKGPQAPLVLFASGDDGWAGTSRHLLEHLAYEGYTIAAFDTSAVVAHLEAGGGSVTLEEAADAVDAVLVRAKRELGLPETAPVVLTGFSRGASLVVFAAGEPSLRRHVTGGVAIALTREGDYVRVPAGAPHTPGIDVDSKGRVLTYPAIARLGELPLAVIQSRGDHYIGAVEARGLFGPDTPARRFYEVRASDHSFSDGRDEMFSDLDASLKWIISAVHDP